VDSAGNIYVVDQGNNTIRKITPAGAVTTLAGTAGKEGNADGTGSEARFNRPSGVAVDNDNNLYVTDSWNDTIRKITPAGVVTTLAGGADYNNGEDGTGSAAGFSDPTGVAVDGSGNLFVADTLDRTIRKVTPGGVVTTLAGSWEQGGSADGTGSAAQFEYPTGVAVDGAGNVYVTDWNDIRKITPGGVVTTLAGSAGQAGYVDGTGTAARFVGPGSVAADGAGNLYVTDSYSIRKVTPGGVVTTFAGSKDEPGYVNGTGTAALFEALYGVAMDSAGNLYVTDGTIDLIRKVTPAGVVTTLAGYPSGGSTGGPGDVAQFNGPSGVAADGAGNVYVADRGNNTIRKVTSDGFVTTLAGTAGQVGSADGTGSAARFNAPNSVAVDGAGNVYVADSGNDTIRKITPGGVVTTLAGLAGVAAQYPNGGVYEPDDGTGSAARFSDPQGVAADGAGNVYVADTAAQIIRKITPAGVVTTLAGQPGRSGSRDGPGNLAQFLYPYDVAVDGAGNVFVADSGNFTIRKITPGGIVSTPAGTVGQPGGTDGRGGGALFNTPQGLAVDGAGNVYVADIWDSEIRKLTPSTGVVTTIAGSGYFLGGLQGGEGSADGTGGAAQFSDPQGVAVDSAGTVYVADTGNNTIRMGFSANAPSITAQPSPVEVAVGGNASFTVEVAGTPAPTCLWEVSTDGGGVWGNVPPYGGFSGETTSTLRLSGATAAMSGYQFRCVATNAAASATSETAGLTVDKWPQTISFTAPASTTYGAAPFAPSATATSGLPVSFSVASGAAAFAEGKVVLTGAGMVTLAANQAGDSIYSAAPEVDRRFMVAKASQTISFTAPANMTYGAAPFAPSATATSGLPVSFSIVDGPASLSGGKVVVTGAGAVTMAASQEGNSSYSAAPEVGRRFTVGKASQTITFAGPARQTYGAAPFKLVATATSGLTVTFAVVSGPAMVSGNTITLTGVGTVLVHAYQAGNANYNAASPVGREFRVAKGG
jgi:hypothetical protein